MFLLTALWRVVRAIGSGLGYAALIGVILSSPLFFLLRLQPPCNQAEGICEEGGFGLFTLFVLWLGLLLGFITGVVLSALRVRPISRIARRITRWLSRQRPIVKTAGFTTAAMLMVAVVWLGNWIVSGRGPPPQVSMDVEIPFHQSLGVGLARVETLHRGGGCVSFGVREPDGPTSRATLVYEISSTRSSNICPGVNQPETQELLLVAYDHLIDPPSSVIPVEVYMAPNWYDEATFGNVSFPSPEPQVLGLDTLAGEVDEDPLIWRINLDALENGFAVPVVTAVQGDLEPSLWKLDENDNRTDLSTRLGAPSWSHACDRHTCDLGWALIVWPPDSEEKVAIGIEMEVWVFETDAEPTLTVVPCAEGRVGNYEIDCALESG